VIDALQAMEVCYAAAEKLVDSQAVRALAALSPPHWTPSVIGTAAAVVAEAAKPLCAQQLIAQVGPLTFNLHLCCAHSILSMQP